VSHVRPPGSAGCPGAGGLAFGVQFNWFAMRLTHVHTVPHPEENPGVAHDNSHAAHAAAQHGVKRAVRSPAVPLAKDPPVAEVGHSPPLARSLCTLQWLYGHAAAKQSPHRPRVQAWVEHTTSHREEGGDSPR